MSKFTEYLTNLCSLFYFFMYVLNVIHNEKAIPK